MNVMTDDLDLVRRGTQVLRPDPRRVVTKLFLPGQELLADGHSRAQAVIQRVLDMTDDQVSTTLAEVDRRFAGRHHDLPGIFAGNLAQVESRIPISAAISDERRSLIGAYCTHEFSVEAAALFNPSMVAHPDQSGLDPDEVRFAMSVRAVGEGHISSIEFRSGTLSASAQVRLDDPGPYLVTGRRSPATMTRDFLRDALADQADVATVQQLLWLLPDRFDAADLEQALTSVQHLHGSTADATVVVDRARWIAACNYCLAFPAERGLDERVIYPTGLDETHGVEDARFTRFVNDDASVTYYAFYTAFDGAKVAPHLLITDDFLTFEMTQVVGLAARDKGMALFPRRVGGHYLAMSRWDRESIGVASSPDARRWGPATTVLTPSRPWDLIQLGNCGPPIETSDGWLVLIHGVGPMRTYGIGAILLDLDEPTKLIGALADPILTPSAEERDGYVPNVLYSCGGMVHGQTLVLPYGCSDSSIRFASVDLGELLKRLRESASAG